MDLVMMLLAAETVGMIRMESVRALGGSDGSKNCLYLRLPVAVQRRRLIDSA